MHNVRSVIYVLLRLTTSFDVVDVVNVGLGLFYIGSTQVIRNGRCEIEADRAVPPFVPWSLTGKFESVLSFHILNLDLLRSVFLYIFLFWNGGGLCWRNQNPNRVEENIPYFFFVKKKKKRKKKLLIYTTVSFVTNNNLIVNRIINVSIQHEMMQPTIRWTLNNNNQLWGVLIKTIVH